MKVKDLLFYGKDGFPINLNYDADSDMWSGKQYFDKNSTDTFKTQAIYMFEKVLGTNNNFEAYLEKFQAFNTDGIFVYPKFNATSIEITDIQKANTLATFYTKWIYATDIEMSFYEGQYVYFEGLSAYHGTDFDELSSGDTQVFQIIILERGRALVRTATNNSVALPAFVAGPSKVIVPLAVIEYDQQPTPDAWNESAVDTKLFDGKKISLVSETSDNTGVYTIDRTSVVKNKYEYRYGPAAFAPTQLPSDVPDKFEITVETFTDRILVSDGSTEFAPLIDPNGIQLPYIPSFVQIGTILQGQSQVTPLIGGNTVAFTVTAIDKTTNVVTVTPAPVAQSVTCYIYLSTNKITLKQDVVLDNNNLYSLPLTYWTMVNSLSDQLDAIGIAISYDTATDELVLKSKASEDYFTVSANRYDAFDVLIGSVAITTTTVLNAYPMILTTEPVALEEIKPDSTRYFRSILFNTIDTFGLNIRINGVDYNVDYDTDVNNTLIDWITAYAADLALLGITAAQVGLDTLTFTADYPNLAVFMELSMGDFSDYAVAYKTIEFNNIKSQLLITINDTDYAVPFVTSDTLTIASWVTTYQYLLKTLGIIASSVGTVLSLDLLDPEKSLNITYNIGYLPKSGDLSVYETLIATNANGSLIAGNEVRIVTGTYNFLTFYATGQKIALSGATMVPQNISYNIIGLTTDRLSLSYQGPFWQEGLPVFTVNLVSDYFIRYPKYGLSEYNNAAVIAWSFKDTKVADFFLYDFSGDQLVPPAGFPAYTGQLPLCGADGQTELKLNTQPNSEVRYLSDPTKQQTVFEEITHTLPFTDDAENIESEPEPVQVFIGYGTQTEGFNKTRLYLELREDITYSLTTDINLVDDLWTFDSETKSVTVTTATTLDFRQLGFTAGQNIRITARDINIDNRNIGTMLNAGKVFRIKEVYMQKLVFADAVISETSVVSVPKTTLPYYDITGNPLSESRTMEVTLTVIPKIAAYFDFYGESEGEDERHRINLDNRNKNILKLQDFYIFKEVDINENGIDWIFMNRKRKQLLEIYPEIFNYISAYKSVIQSINFFGYNDLSFTEYTQNVDPESSKFGQLFNMELVGIFDKSVSGWSFSNIAFENLRNKGYRKTNLFSLNYKVTDKLGNFVDGYSFREVQIKLNGLKRWLTENIIPIGTKILDINGKYQMPDDYVIQHTSVMTRNFRVEEYSAPVDFDVTGYSQPVTTGSDTYNISVQFKSMGTIEWFDYRIRTFALDMWNNESTYLTGMSVYWDGKVWVANTNTAAGEEPGVSGSWDATGVDSLSQVQLFKDYRFDDTGTSFTVDKLVDPHFIVEVHWHSGYACTMLNRKVYSVIPDFFTDAINI